jgi:hypothetical protein
MKIQSSHYDGLADRPGFNAAVRHIKATVGIIDRVGARENLSDILEELLESKAIGKDEILSIVSMVLGQKYPYRAISANLLGAATDLAAIGAEVSTWNGIDFVVVYHHPDLGVMAINPKNLRQIGALDRVNRAELLVVWAGRFTKEGDPVVLDAAARALIDLFSGKAAKAKPEFLKGDCVYKQPRVAGERREEAKAAKTAPPAKAAAKTKAAKLVAGGVKASKVEAAAPVEPPEHKAAVVAERALKPGTKMTPLYSVLVTNELFHNGNVEAWKRVIASYTTKHPDLQVLVYYDGERIMNLNALFKWGKVKHGSMIQFAIVGDDISDVAKLQRYLAQGASHMYEAFLRGPVNNVLTLF